GQSPLVTLTVQSKKRKVAACAANAISRVVVEKLGAFADRKIANFKAQIAAFNADIAAINTGLRGSDLGTTDKLVLGTRLTTDQQQKITLLQLLQQAALV